MDMQLTMSEQDMLNDLLNQEKKFIADYSYSITEASCPNLRQLLTTTFEQVCQDQYKIYDLMAQKGYYPTKDAMEQDVTSAQQKFSQMKNELH